MKQNKDLLATLGLGCLGLALQLWCQSTAFDPDTRLVLPGAIAYRGMFVYAALLLVVAVVLALRPGRPRPQGDGTLYTLQSRPGRVLGQTAGLLTGLGGVLLLTQDVPLALAAPDRIQIAMCAVDALLVVSGLCMIVLALRAKAVRHSLAALAPGFGVCFWLVFFYHDQSKDPVVFHYAWTLLAQMASALACYQQAAYSFERAKDKAARVFTLLAGCLALTALPACQTLAEGLLLTGLAAWMLMHTLLLPKVPADTPASASPEAAEEPN